MGSILDHIENMIKRERIIKTAVKKMSGGEQWIYPVELKKGCAYSLSAHTNKAAAARCSLLNGRDDTPLEQSAVGTRAVFSITPEEDGVYRLLVTTQPGDALFHKVTIKVRKAYIPSRIRAWSCLPVD